MAIEGAAQAAAGVAGLHGQLEAGRSVLGDEISHPSGYTLIQTKLHFSDIIAMRGEWKGYYPSIR
jgi:hypothetical protein